MKSQHRWLSGAGRRLVAIVGAVAIAAGGALAIAVPAGANTSTASVPYSCTTNVGINQAATYSATITDSVDPAAIGQSVTYQFVVPFDQAPPPVTATYLGGTVTYPIPPGLTVTAVSTPPKAGSNLSSTVQVQGSNIVVTTTGSQPIDGGNHPAPDLFVTGTVTAVAAGVGVVWRTPSKLVANVNAQIVGSVVATCLPDDPNAVIATTTVPGTPLSPKATNQTVAVPYGATKGITLSATDPDTPLAQLTYSVTTNPAHGALTGTAPNLVYKPTAKYVGTDSFTFTAHDPQGLSGVGTISIKDLPAISIDNDPPTVAITAPANGSVFTTGQVVKAAYTCSDVTTAVESCTGSVANGASISTTTGAHSITIDATDTAGNRGRQTVSYRVIDPAIVKQNFNSTNVIPLACDDLVPPLTPRTVPATASAPSQVGDRPHVHDEVCARGPLRRRAHDRDERHLHLGRAGQRNRPLGPEGSRDRHGRGIGCRDRGQGGVDGPGTDRRREHVGDDLHAARDRRDHPGDDDTERRGADPARAVQGRPIRSPASGRSP